MAQFHVVATYEIPSDDGDCQPRTRPIITSDGNGLDRAGQDNVSGISLLKHAGNLLANAN